MEKEVLSWLEPQPGVEAAINQNGNNITTNNNNNISLMNSSDPNIVLHSQSHLSLLKEILEGDWYVNNNNHLLDQNDAFHLDSSSCFFPSPDSCSSPFSNDTTTTTINHPFHNYFNSLDPFQATSSHVLMGLSPQMTSLNKYEPDQFGAEQHVFGPSNAALVPSEPKVLRPLQSLPLVGAPPSLFQKQAASSSGAGNGLAPVWFGKEGEVEGWLNNDSEDEDVFKIWNSYNSKINENSKSNSSNDGNDDNDLADGEDRKGKKGMPAKNLLIERQRRKKLNDKMFLLRSIVPKISKMDKLSILVDAVDYLKELEKRISDLHTELKLRSPGSSVPPCTSFHRVTSTLQSQGKKEPCPRNQSPKVEVRAREGRNVSIHMFCARRPGTFFSTMRALDSLGLDVQEAVINCFNGFSLDVFKAEQCKEDHVVPLERIKTVLLETTGFPGMI